MDSSKIGFTFWGNMKETVDRYQDPVLKYKIYDAITEYGLYGILPEEHDNMTLEEQTVNAAVQSFVVSLDKSRIYNENQQQKSIAGGKVKKIELTEIEEGVRIATRKKGKVPTRDDVVAAIKEEYDLTVSTKTVSRNCNDERKRQIANEVLAAMGAEKPQVQFNFQGQRDIRDKTETF